MSKKQFNKTAVIPFVIVCGIVLFGIVMYLRMPRSSGSNGQNQTMPPVGSGETITLSGEFVCLPHKNASGSQTMECAYGLKTPEGNYYALRDSDPQYKNISGVTMGKKVSVTGVFTPREDDKYPTEGIFEVQSVTAQ